jgi:hypothetical protein
LAQFFALQEARVNSSWRLSLIPDAGVNAGMDCCGHYLAASVRSGLGIRHVFPSAQERGAPFTTAGFARTVEWAGAAAELGLNATLTCRNTTRRGEHQHSLPLAIEL